MAADDLAGEVDGFEIPQDVIDEVTAKHDEWEAEFTEQLRKAMQEQDAQGSK